MIYQGILDRCPHISTEDMGYEEWLLKRRDSIGGSDAGAIMGLSGKYGSPLTVFLQKKGLEKSRETSPAAQRGKLLEPLIRDWFAASFPSAIIEKVPYMFYGPGEYERMGKKLFVPPLMSANIDGLILAQEPIIIGDSQCSGLGGLEIKSSRDGFDFSDDEIPDTYFAQVQHYMAVLNLDWFVVSVAILSKEEIQNYIIPRNDDFIYLLIEAETKFWNNHILTNKWPAAMGLDSEEEMITGLYNGSASILNLTEEELELCRKILDLKEEIKPLEMQEEAAKTDLKAKLIARAKPNGSEKKLSAIGGPFSVSWSFYETRRLDSDALRKAGLYDQFSKVSETNRLTVSMKKSVIGM